MTILPRCVGVTGASGFLGRHVIAAVERLGVPVVAITRTDSELSVAQRRLADVTDPVGLAEALRGCDAVIHLAAVTPAATIASAPDAASAVNVGGTANVIEASRQSGVRRIIFVSSGKVYAPDARHPVDEEAPCRPRTPLGIQKLAAENILRAETWQVSSLSAATLRMFNVYGPGQRSDFLIPKIVDHLGVGRIALGDVSVRRDFLYVEDAVASIVTVLIESKPGYAVYNVGTGVAVAIEDVVATVARVGCTQLVVRFDPAQVRGHEPALEVADARRIRSLGWAPEIDLASGLRRVVESHASERSTSPVG